LPEQVNSDDEGFRIKQSGDDVAREQFSASLEAMENSLRLMLEHPASSK
jgi:hypothetical protein